MTCFWLFCGLMLQHWYAEDNRLLFGGQLPHSTQVYFDNVMKPGCDDLTTDTRCGLAQTSYWKGRYYIQLDGKYFKTRRELVRPALRHEECHVYSGNNGHDDAWTECMWKLAAKGVKVEW